MNEQPAHVKPSAALEKFLSPLGKRMHFPKGIPWQSREISGYTGILDATAGVARTGGKLVACPPDDIFIDKQSAGSMYTYAPCPGLSRLREVWRDTIVSKNPLVDKNRLTLPVVTSGLSHGLSIAADLFTAAGTPVLLPGPAWDNYSLIFGTRRAARIHRYDLFDSQGQFTVESITAVLAALPSGETCVLVLNFPNNPSGYSPSQAEVEQIALLLASKAAEGYRFVILIDDAYTGLWYSDQCYKHSVFQVFHNLDPAILAVKIDGATKEEHAWGLRVGFISCASSCLNDTDYSIIENKITGCIRSSISSCCRLSQELTLRQLEDPACRASIMDFRHEMKKRWKRVTSAVGKHKARNMVLPFNSGYFVTFITKPGMAERIRRNLLLHENIGVISLENRLIRVSYSCLDCESIPAAIEAVVRRIRAAGS